MELFHSITEKKTNVIEKVTSRSNMLCKWQQRLIRFARDLITNILIKIEIYRLFFLNYVFSVFRIFVIT